MDDFLLYSETDEKICKNKVARFEIRNKNQNIDHIITHM